MKSTSRGWKRTSGPRGATGLVLAILTIVAGAATRVNAQSPSEPDASASAGVTTDPSDGGDDRDDRDDRDGSPRGEPVPSTSPDDTVPSASATASAAPAPEADVVATTSTTNTRVAAPESDDDDGDRNRHFWVDAAIGYSWIALGRLDQSNFAPETTTTTSSGIVAEVGFGVEVSVMRFGLAGSYARYDGFDVGTAELDVQLVIPIPIIQPYIEAGFGYGWIGNVEATNPDTSATATVPIHGIAIDLGIGLDIAVSDVVQFGIGVDASFLNLQRQRVTELDTIGNVDFTQSGNSLGLQLHGVGRITFQF